MPRTTATLKESNADNELEALDQEKEAKKINSSDFKDLVLLGKLSEEIDISGYTFKVSTLTAREQKNIMKHIMSLDEMDRILGSKAVAVAYSVQSINDVPMSNVSEDSEGETEMDRRLDFILGLQSSVIERLYSKYESLVDRSSQEVGLESLKK